LKVGILLVMSVCVVLMFEAVKEEGFELEEDGNDGKD
jgi:hypothetical protein